jgi:hypothetical protein
MELVPVQVQAGIKKCGCFVIAASVLFGDNPSMLASWQKE